MFFRKRIRVHDLVLLLNGELNRRRTDRLTSVGIVDTDVLSDLDKLAISEAVDRTVAGVVMIAGLMQRFVDAGPHHDRQTFLALCVMGLREANAQHISDVHCDKIVQGVWDGLEAMFRPPLPANAREVWERQYRLLLPEFRASEDHYAFFAELVAEQNRILVPLLDEATRKFKPVLG